MTLQKWDRRFLQLASVIVSWSKDPSTQVAAILVTSDNKRIISTGINGFPTPVDDDPSEYANREIKYSQIVHAEINAILFATRDLAGSILYTWPFMPCDKCAPIVIQAGIKRVISPFPNGEQMERWGESFNRSRNLFAKAGVSCEEVNLESVWRRSDLCDFIARVSNHIENRDPTIKGVLNTNGNDHQKGCGAACHHPNHHAPPGENI